MIYIQVSMCYCVQYQYCKYQTIFFEMDRLFGQILPDIRAKFAWRSSGYPDVTLKGFGIRTCLVSMDVSHRYLVSSFDLRTAQNSKTSFINLSRSASSQIASKGNPSAQTL